MKMIGKAIDGSQFAGAAPITNEDSDEEVVTITRTKKRYSNRLLIKDDSDEEKVERVTEHASDESPSKNTERERYCRNGKDFEVNDDKENDEVVVSAKQRSRILNWSKSSDDDDKTEPSDPKSKQPCGAGQARCNTKQKFQDSNDVLKVISNIGQSDALSCAPQNPNKAIFANPDIFDAEGSSSDEGGGRFVRTIDPKSSTLDSDDDGISLAELKKAAKGNKKNKKGDLIIAATQKSRRSRKRDLKEIHSESQRLVRESRVKLPYHVPQQRTLDEFLNRRKSAPAVLKPSSKEVETILKKCSALNEKTKENVINNPVLNPVKRKLTMDELNAKDTFNPLRAVNDDFPRDVHLLSTSVCHLNDKHLPNESTSNIDVCEIKLEKTLPGSIATAVPEEFTEVCEALSTGNLMKDSSSNDITNLISDPPKEQSPYGTDPALTPTVDVSRMSLIDSEIHQSSDGIMTDLSESVPVIIRNIRCEKMLTAAKNFTPKLGGQPNTVISLDLNEEACTQSSGVHGLIERFIQHTTPKQFPQDVQPIKLSILKKEMDSSGEQKLTIENILVNASVSPVAVGNSTPGAALTLLKETLKANLAKKRAEMRQKRRLLQTEENETGFDGEEEILSDITDSEEETDDDCEADEEDEATDDDDLDKNKEVKKKPKSVFLDDEALEENNDEYLTEEDDDDEFLEEDSGDLEKEAGKKNEQITSKELGVANLSPLKSNRTEQENCSADVLKLHLESEDSEMTATQPVTSNEANNETLTLSRCTTLELFPSPVRDDQTTGLREVPSFLKTPNLDTSFELIGSNIAAYQPGGGMLHRKETPSCSGFSMKRNFSQLSLPIEDSQQLFQDTPSKDSVLPFDEFELSPLGFATQLDSNTGATSIRRRLGFVDGTEMSTQENMNELFSLCSGKWTDYNEKQTVTNDESYESQSLANTQEIKSSLLDVSSSSFPTKALTSVKYDDTLKDGGLEDSAKLKFHDAKSDIKIQDQPSDIECVLKPKNTFLSDDELSISSLRSEELLKSRRRKVKQLMSDLESDDEDGSNSAINDDSDNNENVHVKGFFEDEAELSGSDASSDENEELAVEDDVLEEELGDLDEYSEDEVKNQVEKVHMKMMMDEDQRQLRLYKEMYLEDGDLHTDGKGRIRKFRWRNIDDDDSADAAGMVRLSESEDEEMHENENVELRLLRHEREKWLRDHKVMDINDEKFLLDDGSSQFTTLKRKVNILSRNNSLLMKSTTENNQHDSSNGLKKAAVNFCGSFLSRSKDVLSKIAEMTKGVVDGASNGPRNSRNFVFATISPTKEEPVEPPAKMRRVCSVPFPVVNGQPSLSKRLSLPNQCSTDESIFDLL